jgi:hypothetical protein
MSAFLFIFNRTFTLVKMPPIAPVTKMLNFVKEEKKKYFIRNLRSSSNWSNWSSRGKKTEKKNRWKLCIAYDRAAGNDSDEGGQGLGEEIEGYIGKVNKRSERTWSTGENYTDLLIKWCNI